MHQIALLLQGPAGQGGQVLAQVQVVEVVAILRDVEAARAQPLGLRRRHQLHAGAALEKLVEQLRARQAEGAEEEALALVRAGQHDGAVGHAADAVVVRGPEAVEAGEGQLGDTLAQPPQQRREQRAIRELELGQVRVGADHRGVRACAGCEL